MLRGQNTAAHAVPLRKEDDAMKALAVKVKWWEGYANDPVLQFLVDEVPPMDAFRFKKNGPIYYAELDGLVRYYAYTNPDMGFGGHHFHVTMKDETEVAPCLIAESTKKPESSVVSWLEASDLLGRWMHKRPMSRDSREGQR